MSLKIRRVWLHHMSICCFCVVTSHLISVAFPVFVVYVLGSHGRTETEVLFILAGELHIFVYG